MTLYIGKTLITTQNKPEDLISLTLSLPEIPVISYEDQSIPDQALWLCSQREMLTTTRENLDRWGIEYLGTKNVEACLVFFLYSEEPSHYLLVHVDDSQTFSEPFNQWFLELPLSSRSTISVYCAGGKDNALSRSYLVSTLMKLEALSQNHECNVIVTQQFLWTNNTLSSEDQRNTYLVERIIRKLGFLYKEMFTEFLPEKSFDHINGKNFQTHTTAPVATLDSLSDLLSSVRPVSDKQWLIMMRIIKNFLFPSPEPEKTKALFFKLAEGLFSREAYPIIYGRYQDLIPEVVLLRHFAFSIHTHRIVTMRESTNMPYEFYRFVRLIQGIESPQDPHLVCVVQTHPRLIFLKPLKPSFLEACSTLQQLMIEKKNDREVLDAQVVKHFNIYAGDLCSCDSTYQFILSAEHTEAQLSLQTSALGTYKQGIGSFSAQQYAPALDQFKKAASLFLSQQNGQHSLSSVKCYSSIASCLRELDDLQASLAWLEFAIEVATRLKNIEELEKLNVKKSGIRERMKLALVVGLHPSAGIHSDEAAAAGSAEESIPIGL